MLHETVNTETHMLKGWRSLDVEDVGVVDVSRELRMFWALKRRMMLRSIASFHTIDSHFEVNDEKFRYSLLKVFVVSLNSSSSSRPTHSWLEKSAVSL